MENPAIAIIQFLIKVFTSLLRAADDAGLFAALIAVWKLIITKTVPFFQSLFGYLTELLKALIKIIQSF